MTEQAKTQKEEDGQRVQGEDPPDKKRGRQVADNRKRRLGDRRDGRRLRTIPPYNALTPYIMKTKNDANNFFSDSVEISEAENYLRAKRLNGYPGMGLLHLFIAAYIRVASQYPGINRFISGQRIFARYDIVYVMTIKKEMKTEAGETTIKVVFDPRDTIDDVYRKLNAELAKVKEEGEDTDTDDVAKTLMKMPRLILKFCIYFLGLLDYFGKIPMSLINASPFHGSMIITDLGSIGIPPIYHHLYNFGNMPLFAAFGTKRKSLELKAGGEVIERKYLDYKIVVDERICDGFYFSQAFRLFKQLLRKPEVLDAPPEIVVEDVE